MSKKKQVGPAVSTTMQRDVDFKGRRLDMESILKDIEFLGSSHMTWKERKELENKKVVALGGKPPKKQRLPLSVARVTMKKQKEREQKMVQEGLILGRFGCKLGSGERKGAGKRKPEDRVLKSTQGHFRNGVLDVKHLLQPAGPRESDHGSNSMANKGKRKKGGQKKQGKKGGGRRRG